MSQNYLTLLQTFPSKTKRNELNCLHSKHFKKIGNSKVGVAVGMISKVKEGLCVLIPSPVMVGTLLMEVLGTPIGAFFSNLN